MSFLTPLSFILMILLPLIIAMYLLKLRRKEQIVSSTYLWQRMVRDVEANAPWQRLRRNLLLLLQLIFILALIFALARPFTWAEGGNAQATILIFDTSASMAATDLTPNRLEAAKEQARLLVSNLPEESRGTIIAAGENTQVLVSSSQDKRQLYQSLDNLDVQPGGSDLTSALELASAIAARQPDAEIVIYSDGRVELPERLNIQARVRFIPIGESGNNQAITLITLSPGMNTDTLTAFIQVANYSHDSVQRRLTLAADGHLIDAQDLEIPAQGQVAVISEVIPIETEVLEATLNASDALPWDDHAWAVPQVSRGQSITLIGPGNRFLETVLGLLPGFETNLLSPEDYVDNQPAGDLADLIIFDTYVPTGTLPTSNLFFIGPLASTPFFSIIGNLETPLPKVVEENITLLEHVDFNNVSILDAAQISLPDWMRPVLVDEKSNAPLLFIGERNGQRVAGLTFDPRHSDLPLHVAYPILMANLADWLLPGGIGDMPDQVQPGEALSFTPPPEVTSLRVTRPDGSSTQLEIQERRAIFADTSQLGIYTVSWGENNVWKFAVNLSNPQEADIRPADSLSFIDDSETSKEGSSQLARKEWWRPLATLALIVLVLEWLVYHRATLSKLWQTLPFRRRENTPSHPTSNSIG